MPKLKACVENHNPLIIAITEVIPKNYRIPVQKAELKISNYDILPENISCKGRGITIQIHKDLKAQEISFKTDFKESIWCEVKLKGQDKLVIGCIYRSESRKSDNNKMLNKLLKEANKERYSHLLIMVDFNDKDIMWNQGWSTPGQSENSEEFLFVETLRDC